MGKLVDFTIPIILNFLQKLHQTKKFINDGILNEGNVNPIICEFQCI
jgi:hypothetical protein